MNGLFLGLMGGVAASIATIVGALLIFFKIKFNKESAFKLQLDFFIGLLLTITAVSLIYPTSIEKNINLGIAAFVLGFLILILSKIMLKNVLESIAINNIEEQKAILFILVIMLKNIPVGLAAGASMNLSHGGLGNSLLTAIAFHNIFEGTVLALCFLSLGLDPLLAIIGVMGSGLISIASGLVGGYSSQESLIILPMLMAFAGGALMSTIMYEAIRLIIREFRKLLLSPSFVSAIVVMLIFIVWKEFL
jgi:zinc transporter, ZIP family